MKTAQLEIDGMHCQSCVARVTTILQRLPNVIVDSVTVGTATIRYDEAKTTPSAVVQAIEKSGADARLVQPAGG